MKMKKAMVVLLMLLFVLGTLSAAGQTETQKSSGNGAAYPDVVDPFGKYEEPVVVTFALPTNDATDFPKDWDYADNIWTRELLAQMNIKMELSWSAAQGEAYDTRMNLAIASGDLPDLFTLSNASQFSRLVEAGRLADLTEAFEKFAYPQFKKWFSEDGGTRLEWGTVGDRLYGIAPESVPYMSARMIFVRKDWREDLGISKPKTMNDILDMAKAFKAVDPDHRYGILITQDILDNSMSDIFAIANSMGVYPRRWIEQNGKLVYGSIQPGMKDVLAVYRDLYDNGLINPEFATTSGGDSAPQLTNGMVGIAPNGFWLYSWPLNSLYESEGVEWECYPVLPMEGYSSDVHVSMDKTTRKFFAARAGFEHPEALMKVLNFETFKINDPEGAEQRFHSDDNYSYFMMVPFLYAIGPLRTNYDTNINVTKAIDTKDTSYLVSPHDHQQYERVRAYFDSIAAGEKPTAADWVAKNFFYGENSSFGVLNYYWENNMFMVSPAAGIKTDEMIRREETLNQMEVQAYVEIITGKKPLDAFDKFVSDWRNLGGSVMESEINEWYQSIQ